MRLGWPDKDCVAPAGRRSSLRARVKGRIREGIYGTYARSLLDWIDEGEDGVPAVDINLMSAEEIRGHVLSEARKVESNLALCGARGLVWARGDGEASWQRPAQGWNVVEQRPIGEKGDARRRCKALGDKAEADRVAALRPAGLAPSHTA